MTPANPTPFYALFMQGRSSWLQFTNIAATHGLLLFHAGDLKPEQNSPLNIQMSNTERLKKNQFSQLNGRTTRHISDLRFHDFRHEAASKFFGMGLNQFKVTAIAGLKTCRIYIVTST